MQTEMVSECHYLLNDLVENAKDAMTKIKAITMTFEQFIAPVHYNYLNEYIYNLTDCLDLYDVAEMIETEHIMFTQLEAIMNPLDQIISPIQYDSLQSYLLEFRETIKEMELLARKMGTVN